MRVMILDVKGTHVNNPDCPMRLAPMPRGGSWYCVDCGFEILQASLAAKEMPGQDDCTCDHLAAGQPHDPKCPQHSGKCSQCGGSFDTSPPCGPSHAVVKAQRDELWENGAELQIYQVPARIRNKLEAQADLIDQQGENLFYRPLQPEECRKHGIQNCHDCPDTGCCDNMTKDEELAKGVRQWDEGEGKKFTPETEQFRQEWPAKILWYPDDGTCPVCQEAVKHDPEQKNARGVLETYSYIGRPVHKHCFGTVSMWSSHRDLVPNRLRCYKERNGEIKPRFSPDELERGPYWAGKDIVGVLKGRGWKVTETGMVLRGPGMLSDHFIPVLEIVKCTDAPGNGAVKLEMRAGRRSKGR